MNASMRRDMAGFILAYIFVLIFFIHAAIILYLYHTYDFATFMLGALVSQQFMLIGFLQSWHFVDKNIRESKLELEDEPVTQCIAATTSTNSRQGTQFTGIDAFAPDAVSERTEDADQCVPSMTWNSTKWPTLVSLASLRSTS
jgi:hypothetical protein